MTIKETQTPQQTGSVSTAATAGRIVVGVDGSPGSLRALRWALSEASARGGNVHTVGVWQSPGGMHYTTLADTTPPKEAMEAAVAATVAAATAPAGDGKLPRQAAITVSVVEGIPAIELQPAVVDGDLVVVVVGPRGHREVVGLLLGSVSQHVVSRARCPVVVVPSVGHPDELL
jgi:nucleotide-binding universal stress UspA family protein